MGAMVFWGLLTPFFGTSLGAACVFFLKKGLGGSGAAWTDRLFLRRYGGCVHLESADPRHGAVRRGGDGLPAGGYRLLGWYPLSFGTGSSDPPPPPAKPAGGGSPHTTAALHHDGAGGHPPQYPGGNGGGGWSMLAFCPGGARSPLWPLWPYLWASPFRTSPKGPSSLCRCVLRG